MATKRTYRDFRLEFDVFVENGLNSGVQFRSLSSPDYNNGRVHGRITNGWRATKLGKFTEKGWEIKDGTLTVLASDGAESRNGGDIVTKDSFKDFELSVDLKISAEANSGIKYFVDSELNKGEGSAIGMEFQVLDGKAHPDAKQGKNGNRTVGSPYDLIRAGNMDSSRDKNFKGIGNGTMLGLWPREATLNIG